MTLFVGANQELRNRVKSIITDETRVAFVSCPDVIHAAMMKILRDEFLLNETNNSDDGCLKESENALVNGSIPACQTTTNPSTLAGAACGADTLHSDSATSGSGSSSLMC